MTHPDQRTPAHAGVQSRCRHNGTLAILGLVALFGLLTALPLSATAQTFPKFTGLVVDDANVLPPQVESDLAAKLESLQKDTKRQLVVATIADLQGYPLDEYGYKLGRTWGVGLRDVNNGAILLLAPNNPAGQRGPRIEVGRGLEPFVTDALANVVIRRDMLPKLRAGGDIAGAMTAGTDALIAQLRASPDEAKARTDAAIVEFDKANRRSTPSRGDGGFPIGLVVPILILGFVGLAFLRRGGGGRRYRGTGSAAGGVAEVVLWSIANEVARGAFRGGGGGWGGGGGGGGSDGGWGGGGFTGGGGGDFGGGGASGDW